MTALPKRSERYAPTRGRYALAGVVSTAHNARWRSQVAARKEPPITQDEDENGHSAEHSETKGVPAAQSEKDVAAYAEHRKRQQEHDAERKWEKRHSTLQLWFNGFVALTAFFGISITIYQIRESRLSSAENAKDVARSFGLAERSADAAERAAKAAERAAVATEEAVGVSEGNLQEIRNSTRLNQRARIGYSEVNADSFKNYSQTEPIVVSVAMTNSGKTPALVKLSSFIVFVSDDCDAAAAIFSHGGKLPPEYTPEYRMLGRDPAPENFMIQPGEAIKITARNNNLYRLDRVLSPMRGEPRAVLCILGRVEYADVFKETHMTRLCAYVWRDVGIEKYCPTGNDAT